MFSSPALYFPAPALWQQWCDTQAQCVADAVHAVMAAGEAALAQQVDASRMLLATATVAAREWSNAGGAPHWRWQRTFLPAR